MMTTTQFAVVFETEESGAISAFVPGLPVYAAADDRRSAEVAIRGVLAAYLYAHPQTQPNAIVRMAIVAPRGRDKRAPRVTMRSFGAALGAIRSKAKARAARENGKLGGRPRKALEQ